MEVDRTLFAVGGANNDGNLATVSKYNVEMDEWEPVEPMPKALR